MALNAYLARCDLVEILRGMRPDEVVAIGDALEAQGRKARALRAA